VKTTLNVKINRMRWVTLMPSFSSFNDSFIASMLREQILNKTPASKQSSVCHISSFIWKLFYGENKKWCKARQEGEEAQMCAVDKRFVKSGL